MRAKWNQFLAENDPGVIEITPEGPRQGVRMAFCNEDIEMFRQGFKCIDCLEIFDTAFPETCFVCGFECKKYQSELFAQRFAGVREFKSQINEDEELEILARQRHEREVKAGLKSKGIVIPSNVKL